MVAPVHPPPIQHWNDVLLSWEDCQSDECCFTYDVGNPQWPGYMANPAASRNDVCVWCGTGRRHHARACVVVTQPD